MVDQDVLWLQVSIHDSALVQVAQGERNLHSVELCLEFIESSLQCELSVQLSPSAQVIADTLT